MHLVTPVGHLLAIVQPGPRGAVRLSLVGTDQHRRGFLDDVRLLADETTNPIVGIEEPPRDPDRACSVGVGSIARPPECSFDLPTKVSCWSAVDR
jgi:hypothetical protein